MIAIPRLPRNRRAWLRMFAEDPRAIRFYIPWLTSLQEGRSPLYDQRPWITFAAAEWLKNHLYPQMRVFEWGSGGSTLFLARCVHAIISIEHDPAWYTSVAKVLRERNTPNVLYTLVQPKADHADALDLRFSSTDLRYEGMSFRHYVEAVDMYSDSHFDLIVVDGRSRVGCMLHAAPKVRPGGLLLLDNSDRSGYAPGLQAVVGWHRWHFYGPGPYGRIFWGTTIWQRPK